MNAPVEGTSIQGNNKKALFPIMPASCANTLQQHTISQSDEPHMLTITHTLIAQSHLPHLKDPLAKPLTWELMVKPVGKWDKPSI